MIRKHIDMIRVILSILTAAAFLAICITVIYSCFYAWKLWHFAVEILVKFFEIGLFNKKG